MVFIIITTTTTNPIILILGLHHHYHHYIQPTSSSSSQILSSYIYPSTLIRVIFPRTGKCHLVFFCPKTLFVDEGVLCRLTIKGSYFYSILSISRFVFLYFYFVFLNVFAVKGWSVMEVCRATKESYSGGRAGLAAW